MTKNAALPIDAPANGRAWSAQPRPGHEPLAAVCRDLFDRLDAITERMNAAVEREIGEFVQPHSRLPEPDRFRTSRRLIAEFLHGVAEGRGLSEEQTARQRVLGTRIASLGFPLQPMISSFHVTYRELWSMLVEEAARAGGDAPLQLLGVGATIWERMHGATTSLAEGYHDEMNRREALKTRTSVHFIEALADRPGAEECRSLASELGFSLDGSFRVIALVGPVVSLDSARVVLASLEEHGVVAVGAPRGRTAVLVCQDADDVVLDRALAQVRDEASIGIGLRGEGLGAAHMSLLEAERALELALVRGGTCRFEDDWFLAGVLSQRASVERILRRGTGVALAKPHLADAVRAFASTGFSLADSARRLHLSQSTVRYRLKRWHALTGWDPFTHPGLVHSLTALEFATSLGSARSS